MTRFPKYNCSSDFMPSGAGLAALFHCANMVSLVHINGLGTPVEPDVCLLDVSSEHLEKAAGTSQKHAHAHQGIIETLLQCLGIDIFGIRLAKQLIDTRALQMVRLNSLEDGNGGCWRGHRGDERFAVEISKERLVSSGTVARRGEKELSTKKLAVSVYRLRRLAGSHYYTE